MLLGQALVLGAVTAVVAGDASEAAGLRHLYLVPALWAAFRLGAAWGGLIGLLAGLLQAPIALPAVERFGLTSDTVDGLIALVAPVALGSVVGRLVDQSRARERRLRALLEIQQALRRETPFEERLRQVVERIRVSLGADGAGVIVRSAAGDLVAAASPPTRFDEASAAGFALSTGRPISVRDIGTDARIAGGDSRRPEPVRGLALPLDGGEGTAGVLVLERTGDLPAATRAAAEEMAMHLGLAVENARLTLRQRRFAAELADKVREATERLRELDRAKTEFLSVVAHELRTPLTALQGFSELLLSHALPPERARRFLGHVHGEAQRLGRIVTELLDVSRIESGRGPELRPAAVDLGEIIERNVELFAAEHRGHRFEWTLCADAPRLRADPDAVDRMLKNLLSNAVKYSPRGGRVAVAAGRAPDHPARLELSVEDEGVGIAADDLARIFDRYVRIPDPETASARGLGLGLCLVRALAEAHGGSVEVESAPGRGSRFRVLLPV
jgi:signal transduction histidine kinase